MSRTTRIVLVPLLACLLLLAGCSSLDGTGDKGYISGDGRVVQVPPSDRGEPVEIEGEDLDGEPLLLSDLRGKVTVVNVWWSACPPCRAEMPELVEAATELDDVASFVGINIRDPSVEQARGFVRTFEVPYPSFYSPDGDELLPFGLPPNAIPSTIVLDAQGREAASIIGPIPSMLTLTELVEDVVAESAEPAGTGGEGTDGEGSGGTDG